MFNFRICPFEDVSMVGLTEDLVDSFLQVNILSRKTPLALPRLGPNKLKQTISPKGTTRANTKFLWATHPTRHIAS